MLPILFFRQETSLGAHSSSCLIAKLFSGLERRVRVSVAGRSEDAAHPGSDERPAVGLRRLQGEPFP